MKREAEEAELSACQQLRLDVEKNRGHRCARLQNADHAALFDDEQATGSVGGIARKIGLEQPLNTGVN